MTSKEILSLYRNAIRITSAGPEQKHLFDSWLAQPSQRRLMSFDTETTGVIWGVPSWLHTEQKDIECKNPAVFGISLALEIDSEIVLVWTRGGNNRLDFAVNNLLKQKSVKVAHNARYDIRILGEENIAPEVECTYTMSRIYWDRRQKHSLKALTEFLCPELSQWDEPVKKEMTKLKNKYTRAGYPKDYVNYSFVPDELMSEYSMIDSFMCLMLYKHLWPIIKEDYAELYEREKKVFHIINKVESVGLAFDSKKARQEAGKLLVETRQQRSQLQRLARYRFNPNAPGQLRKALISAGLSDEMLTSKGKTTTDAPTLNKIAGQLKGRQKTFVDILLDYRNKTKITNTYLLPLAERAEQNNGIILASINPSDTRTGRMASREPNLQNIPEVKGRRSGKENPVRECFVCRPGFCNYYFDYSQIEMAVFGLYAQEERILSGYNNGEDIHLTMAKIIFGDKCTDYERGITKNINFGIIYGMGIRTMSQLYKMQESEARKFMRIYFEEFPAIQSYQEECKQELQQYGFVQDWFGRRYHISVHEAYKAVNAIVQGSCAQIFKIALINIDELIDEDSHIILPIHDEFILEHLPFSSKIQEKNWCDEISDKMASIEQLIKRNLKLRISVKKSSTSWSEKKELGT